MLMSLLDDLRDLAGDDEDYPREWNAEAKQISVPTDWRQFESSNGSSN